MKRLYQEAEGLPFFVVEYLTSLMSKDNQPSEQDWEMPRSVRELLQSIAQVPAFKEAAPLAARPELNPTRGKKETTDHPPIYPTQAQNPCQMKA